MKKMVKKIYETMQGNRLILTDEEFNNMPFNSRLTCIGTYDEDDKPKEIKKSKLRRIR